MVSESQHDNAHITQQANFARFIVDNMFNVALGLARDGRVIFANDAACTQLGYSRAELLALSVTDIVVSLTAAVYQERWEQLRRLQSIVFEGEQLRKDGSSFAAEVRISFVAFAGEEFALLIARDISELRQTKESLRVSEASFRHMFESSPTATLIWQIAGDDFILVAANAAAAPIMPGSASTDAGMTAAALLQDRPDILDHFRLCKEQHGVVTLDTSYVTATPGRTLEVIMRFVYLSPDMLMLHVEDVTERRRAEAALQHERANMAALLENTDGSIWSMDADCRLLAGNQRFFEDTRRAYGRSLAIGDDLLALNGPPQEMKLWRDCWMRAMRGEHFSIEIQRQTADARWMEYSFSPIRNEAGTVLGVTAFGRVITERKAAEALIKEQLAEITLYYNNAPIGLAVLDADLRFIRVNNLLAATNGVPAADHIGRTVDEVLPSLAVQAHRIRAEILRTGQPVFDIELHGETATQPGVTRYWRENWLPIKREDQTIFGFNVITEEITERKQAETALRASEARFRLAFENANDAICLIDPAGRLVNVNERMCEMLGYSRGELEQMTIAEITQRDDAESSLARMQHALHEPDPHEEFERLYVHRDGHVVWGWVRSALARDESGEPLYFIWHIRDITEQKAATDAMTRSRQNLARAQQIGHMGSWEWDVANARLHWSDELYDIFGVASDYVLTYAAIEALIHPDDRAANNEHVGALLASGSQDGFEFRIVRPDGQIRHIYQNIVVTRDEAGAPVQMYGIMQDITARKEAEAERVHLLEQLAQAQKMETVGRLAGGVAHDFNNMLAVILMRTEMALQGTNPDAPLHRHLMAIYSSAQRSASLVRQLLGFARKQMISPVVLDLNTAVANTMPMLRKLIDEEIALVWLPADDLWPVKMDPTQLDQILTNLCANARDAIAGTGTISIETENIAGAQLAGPDGDLAAPGDYVALVISDTGRGMDEATLQHVFEPFFTTKEVGKGTGLGLATVFGIVEQNHGVIQIYSSLNVGTAVKIFLPRVAEEYQPVDAAANTDLPAGKGESILLVEDEAPVLQMVSEALAHLGYKVTAATSPHGALDLLAENPGRFDLLITDIVMPEMNGRELAERSTALQPGIRKLYISGYPASFAVRRGIVATGEHFLFKPFSLHNLAQQVRLVLDAAPAYL